MEALVWRFIEWHLGRRLTPEQLAATLGDLAEDFAYRSRSAGRSRALAWLVRESLSVSAAYRQHAVHEDRSSRRMIMGASWPGDVRFALRRVIRRPAPSAASVLTLAGAIAAAAVTWSLLSALLLHPLPVDAPDTLVMVGSRFELRHGGWSSVSYGHVYPQYAEVRQSDVFEQVAAGGGRTPLLVGQPGTAPPELRAVYFASHDFFSTLGVRIAMGRDFTEHDDRPGAPLTAVVSHRYWRTVLDGDPQVIGRELAVSDGRATIVGVAPRRFRGLSLAGAPDVYLPLHTIGDIAHTYANPFADQTGTSPTAWVTIIGRLHPRASAEQAAARLNDLPRDRALSRSFELLLVNRAAIPEAARAGMVQFTRLLATTVALMLLIGCLTVGMLLLARTEERRAELAMCLALGGTRASLIRGIVFEGAVLTLGGVLLAVPLAMWLFAGLRAFELPGGISIELLEVSLDPGVLLALSALAVVALLVIALAAGVFGVSTSVGDVLRSRGASTLPITRRRTRTAIVAAQVALALVLLAGAGLFSRSLSAALRVNTGFDASRVLTGGVSLGQYGYTPDRAARFFDDLRHRIAARPEVEAVSLLQGQGGMSPAGTLTVNGEPRQFPSLVSYTAIDEHYFSTMGLPILAGRDFSPDDTAGSPLVVIVSESFGRALAGDRSPLGYRITETSARPGEPFAVAEVIGVVPDVITRVTETEPLVKYYALAQQPSMPYRSLVLRAASSPGAAVREVASILRQMDPQLQGAGLQTIEAQLDRQMGPQKLGGFVLGALGGIAALLTMLGAYVLAESMSAVRRREFGIRAALGGSRAHLGGLVLRETVTLVGAGLAAGLCLAWIGAGTIRAFLFRVEPLDIATLGTAAAAILGLTLLVSLKPAIDSARVDLVSTLREE